MSMVEDEVLLDDVINEEESLDSENIDVAKTITQAKPLSALEREWVEKIKELETSCEEAEHAFNEAQIEAKFAKKKWEARVEELRRLIREGATAAAQPLLPGMDSDPYIQEIPDDAWKQTPIAEVIQLTAKQQEKLLNLGITTIGKFEEVRAGNVEFPDGLRSIKGVGQATIDKWEDDLMDWWDKNGPEPQS